MITKRTVLILGAGSSTHVGYPLGVGLVNEICAPIILNFEHQIPKTFTKEQLADFQLRLSRSGHASIDAFLEDNPGDADVGRWFIARCLKQHESERLLHLLAPVRPAFRIVTAGFHIGFRPYSHFS